MDERDMPTEQKDDYSVSTLINPYLLLALLQDFVETA